MAEEFDPAEFAASKPTPAFDPSEFEQFKSAAQPSTAGDIAKSAGIGLVKGAVGLAGMPGDIGSMFNKGVDWAQSKLGMTPAPTVESPLTSHSLTKGLESVTGPLYEPKTTAGHYAQTVGEFVPGMLGGPEGLASRALTRVVAPGIASEAAGQATHGTALEPLEPVARIAGAIAGHGAASGVRGALAEKPNIPTIEELHEAATNGYNNARGYGVEIHRKPVANLADGMLSDLANDGFRERNIPKTWAAIEELKSPLGKHATIDDIESVRKALLRAGSNPLEGAEREAARRATGAIDNYLQSLNPREVAVNPHYAGEVARELKEARGNWAAMKGGQAVLDKIEAAQLRSGSTYSGTNLDNATRQNIRKFLDNPKLKSQLSAAEREQAERIVRGTFVGNASRFIGKNLRWILGTVVGHDIGGIGGVLASHAAGHALTHTGAALTGREAEKLARMVRADSPLGRSLPQPTPTIPASGPSYGLAGELARQPGEPEGRAKGGAVKLSPAQSRKDSHYSPTRGTAEHHCGICEHYRKPNACTKVGGFINAKTGECDWFKAPE